MEGRPTKVFCLLISLRIYAVSYYAFNRIHPNHQNKCPPVCLPTLDSTSHLPSITPKKPKETSQKLTEAQKELCQRLYKLFQNDLNKVSQAIGIPTGVICRQLALEPFVSQLSDPTQTGSSRTKSNRYPSEWSRRKIEAISHPFFMPCTHKEPCSEETCSCIQNGFFCRLDVAA